MKKLKFLLFLPFISLSGCNLSVFKGDYHYNSSDYAPLEEHELSIEDGIENINVNWINGKINIFLNDTDECSVKESVTSYPLYYKNNGSTLDIELAESGISSDTINRLNKTLNIYIPMNTRKLTLSSVNTTIKGSTDISVEEIDVRAVNGSLEFGSLSCLNSYFDLVNCNTRIKEVSSYTLFKKSNKHNMEFDVVNANVELGIDEEHGYNVDFYAVNGEFKSDYKEKNYGEGLIDISFDGVDGSLIIKKINKD